MCACWEGSVCINGVQLYGISTHVLGGVCGGRGVCWEGSVCVLGVCL